MAITYAGARAIINDVAERHTSEFAQDTVLLPLDQSVGHTVRDNVISPISTPAFDSSQLNGYAVIASQTAEATVERPVRLRVMASIAAGSAPLTVDDEVVDGMVPCVEISVGATFPIARSTQRPFDGCVPREHATVLQEGGGGKIVGIIRPPLTAFHKRIAGSDWQAGDLILEKGMLVMPKHTMALASVGIKQIPAMRPARVGVLSVGDELSSTALPQQDTQYRSPDATGPYLTAAIREMGEDSVYLGAIPSDVAALIAYVQEKLLADNLDVLIINGSVVSSRGSACPVTRCVEAMRGEVYFRGVAMHPGESAIFAVVPPIEPPSEEPSHRGFYSSGELTSTIFTPPKSPAPIRRRQLAIFGLPNTPVASAVCFRFLVTPYLRKLTGMAEERELMARVAVPPETVDYLKARSHSTGQDLVLEGTAQADVFRHAILRSEHDGVSVEVSKERSLAKTSPFISSNCWIHVPRGHVGVRNGDVANIFPFCSPRS